MGPSDQCGGAVPVLGEHWEVLERGGRSHHHGGVGGRTCGVARNAHIPIAVQPRHQRDSRVRASARGSSPVDPRALTGIAGTLA